MAVACFSLIAIGTSSATSPPFQELHDHYFPKNDQYQNGEYRKWFDATLSGPPPQSDKDRHQFYRAFYGDSDAFRLFAHHPDRKGEGEFTLTWIKECLVLLLKIGDETFAKLLAREDKTTREFVGTAIEQQVDWTKHDFAKTRSLYSYRYISPSHQAFEKKHGRALSKLISLVAADPHFSAVRFHSNPHGQTDVEITAPKTLSQNDRTRLQRLIRKYIGEDGSLIFE